MNIDGLSLIVAICILVFMWRELFPPETAAQTRWKQEGWKYWTRHSRRYHVVDRNGEPYMPKVFQKPRLVLGWRLRSVLRLIGLAAFMFLLIILVTGMHAPVAVVIAAAVFLTIALGLDV